MPPSLIQNGCEVTPRNAEALLDNSCYRDLRFGSRNTVFFAVDPHAPGSIVNFKYPDAHGRKRIYDAACNCDFVASKACRVAIDLFNAFMWRARGKKKRGSHDGSYGERSGE